MVTRKLREEGDEGQIIYGYKFRPLLSTNQNRFRRQHVRR
jgi:hypothetical protein